MVLFLKHTILFEQYSSLYPGKVLLWDGLYQVALSQCNIVYVEMISNLKILSQQLFFVYSVFFARNGLKRQENINSTLISY